MSENLVTIEIRDRASLLKACDLLHDARCDLNAVKFDAHAQTWTATFAREFFEDRSLITEEPARLLFKRMKFPLAESRLELQQVKSYEVRDRAWIGQYTFNECEIEGKACHFVFCENMEMILEFDGEPRGRLSDVKLLPERGSFVAFRNPFRK